MTLFLIVLAVAGYLLGSIPTGYLVGRSRGIDVRQHGSGNIGATNVFRTVGKGPGIFVFVCDALKGIAAVRLGMWWSGRFPPDVLHFLPEAGAGMIASIACILGHNFPVWLRFKGGKGVATSLGVVIGLVPFAAAICMGVWVSVLFAFRYVSLASIMATIAVPVTIALTARGPDRNPLLIFMSLAAILIILRHRSNIRRLLNGTENRFKKKGN